MNRDEAQQLVSFCQNRLDLENAKLNDEYFYSSLPLCVIDAIFSMGVRYESTQNTVKRFCTYLDIQRIGVIGSNQTTQYLIQDLIELYSNNSIDFMTNKVFQNRQRTSATNGILKAEAVLHIAEVLNKYKVNYFADMDKVMGNSAFETDYKQVHGQGSGISLSYFYMLAGSKTQIKPDRMIIRVIESALTRTVSVEECYPLLLATCNILVEKYPNLNLRILDHAIWQFQREQTQN